MSNRRMLSVFTSALLLFAGVANAEQRYFEFSGTVTRSENQAVAMVGSVVRGSFHYDDATPGGDVDGFSAQYMLDTGLVATVDGHLLISDMTSISLQDYPDSAGDLFDLYSTPGIMIDDAFLPDAFFGFRLLGSGLQSKNLPSSFDLSQFHYAEGAVMLEGGGSVLAEFSVDSIVNVPAPCLKKNGKPDKHCRDKSH